MRVCSKIKNIFNNNIENSKLKTQKYNSLKILLK